MKTTSYNGKTEVFVLVVVVVVVLMSANRGNPKTFHDTTSNGLPPGSDPLPVATVGPHVGWKLTPDLR